MMNLRWSLFFSSKWRPNHKPSSKWLDEFFYFFLLLLFKLDCLINSLVYIELRYNEINKSLVVIWWWWEIIVIIIISVVVVVVVKLILKKSRKSINITHTNRRGYKFTTYDDDDDDDKQTRMKCIEALIVWMNFLLPISHSSFCLCVCEYFRNRKKNHWFFSPFKFTFTEDKK